MRKGAGSSSSLERVMALLDADPALSKAVHMSDPVSVLTTGWQNFSPIRLAMEQAGISASPGVFCLLVSMFTVGAGFAASPFVAEVCLPIVAAAAAAIPFQWLDSKIEARAASFADDYSTLLLAASSSVGAGHTIDLALERAVQLMSKGALVRREVEDLLERTRRGMPRDSAITAFASTVRLPDIELFRAAYTLASANGGKFAPTLERLARVTRDRICLVRSARVSTATMRMTANVLLLMTPVLLTLGSIRTDTFWQTLLHEPVANTAASIGAAAIGAGYLWLRKLSTFKP